MDIGEKLGGGDLWGSETPAPMCTCLVHSEPSLLRHRVSDIPVQPNPDFCPPPHRYFQTGLAKNPKAANQDVHPMEMRSLVGPINDLDNTPFRSLRPGSATGPSGGGVSFPKPQGPAVCSVAPNLPVRPPSSSDNDSIRKNHWDMDYEGLCSFKTARNNVFNLGGVNKRL